jgi:hypothetical protein
MPSGGDVILGQYAANSLSFIMGGIDRGKLDGMGELYLSTSAPGYAFKWGLQTVKSRLLQANPDATAFSRAIGLFNNLKLDVAANQYGPQDDVSQPSWAMWLGGATDSFMLYRIVAGGNVNAGGTPFRIDSSSNLTIAGSTATKSTGTTWANPSDTRMKRNVKDYTTGLEAILRLRPVQFEFNGTLGTVDDGSTLYGLMADEVEPVMPECVSEQEWSPGIGEESVPVKVLDQSNVILALINAVKDLAKKVTP